MMVPDDLDIQRNKCQLGLMMHHHTSAKAGGV